MAQEDIGFQAGGPFLITATSTDKSVFKVPTGGVTTPYNAFEPNLIILSNNNTALSAQVDFYDTDITSAATLTGTPRFSANLAAGEHKTYTREELLGIRFYKEVNVVATNPTVFGHIAGNLIL